MLFLFAISPLSRFPGWGSRLSLLADEVLVFFLFSWFIFFLKYFGGSRFVVGFTIGG